MLRNVCDAAYTASLAAIERALESTGRYLLQTNITEVPMTALEFKCNVTCAKEQCALDVTTSHTENIPIYISDRLTLQTHHLHHAWQISVQGSNVEVPCAWPSLHDNIANVLTKIDVGMNISVHLGLNAYCNLKLCKNIECTLIINNYGRYFRGHTNGIHDDALPVELSCNSTFRINIDEPSGKIIESSPFDL